MRENEAPWAYLIVVFVLGYAWQLVIYLTGGIESHLFPVMMLFPGLVAIVFRRMRGEGFRQVGWGMGRWWYLLPVLIVPLAVTLGVGALLTGLGWGSLSGAHFTFRQGMVEIRGVPMVLGTHTQSIAFFALNLPLSLLVQSVLGSVVTIGEELGWRGYAQERMVKSFGLNRGLILLGVLWGYWHLPVVLMGYNFPNHPVLGALVLMPVCTLFMGVFLGWLYIRAQSIWMPTLAHASMNLSAVLLLTEVRMLQNELLRQLAFISAWGFVAVLCWISWKRRRSVRSGFCFGRSGAVPEPGRPAPRGLGSRRSDTRGTGGSGRCSAE